MIVVGSSRSSAIFRRPKLVLDSTLFLALVLSKCKHDFGDNVDMHVFAPEYIQMLVRVQSFRCCVVGKLGEHGVYIDETIRVAIQQNNRRDDVACRKSHGSIRADGSDGNRRQHIVVVHLKRGVAHDLKPVYN